MSAPAAGFFGDATFQYDITVGGLTSAPATVPVTVAQPAAELISITTATVSLGPNGCYQYQVAGTTAVTVGNRVTVEVQNSIGIYETLGSSNVNRNTGAWSLSSNNSTIVPSSPLEVRVTSSNGTVATNQ